MVRYSAAVFPGLPELFTDYMSVIISKWPSLPRLTDHMSVKYPAGRLFTSDGPQSRQQYPTDRLSASAGRL